MSKVQCPTKHIIGHNQGRVCMGQMTQPTASKHCRKIGPKD